MSQEREHYRSRWPIVVCVLVAFVVGFGVSFVSRNPTPPAEAKIQIADFRVAIPEGETVVTITSRQAEGQPLGKLTIQRQGDTIVGVPEVERRIEPRARLTAEDVAYLRREISTQISSSDPPWQRANKIRVWLFQRGYHLGMPGLSTRKPREAYDQMKQGDPVLCGNLAQIYVALCQAMGLTARAVGLSLTSGSNQLADDWSVAGPVEAMTVSGGQAMSSLAGGRLWQRIQVRPRGRYLMYARVSVVRGFVNWSLADSERGPRSVGTIEPERMSEIVSDVVESQSGYIDVGFDLPSGGAFRVIDVIVTEAPRFNQ